MPELVPVERPRVLVVDDDLALAETLADGLNERGFDAVALASSREATLQLSGGAFHALVTDLRMPYMDGLELLEISRKQAPQRPVIVMTACGALEVIRRSAFHQLTKPFKLDELVTLLNRALVEARFDRGVANAPLQLPAEKDGHR